MDGATSQPNEARGEDPANVSPSFWLRVCLIAACAGLAGAGLLHLLKLTQHVAYGFSAGSFYEGVVAAARWRRVVVLAIAGALTAVASVVIKTAARGHGAGLQEVIWFHDGRMPFVRTAARAVVSIVGVGLGISLGREGALKQAGAAFATLFAGRRSRGPERRLLAACGAAAGIAAAYNVPLGGALFGMEVLLGTVSVELAAPMLLATSIAAGISRKLVHAGPIYAIPHYPPDAAQVVWALVAGPPCGALAALYVGWIGWIDGKKPKALAPSLLAPLAVCLALGLASTVLPQLLGNGRNVVHAALLGGVSIGLVVLLAIAKPLATGLCLGSGIPGGLFTPTCCFGALVGELLGRAYLHAWPGAPDGAYALVGMAAVLAGATHGPLSAIVLVAELTSNAGLVLPALVACTGAVLVARALNSRSLYSARVHAAIETAMKRAPERTISSAARYSVVLSRFVELPHADELVVVDELGDAIGRIARDRVAATRRALKPTANIAAADLISSAD